MFKKGVQKSYFCKRLQIQGFRTPLAQTHIANRLQGTIGNIKAAGYAMHDPK
jgi:hypothetical protein